MFADVEVVKAGYKAAWFQFLLVPDSSPRADTLRHLMDRLEEEIAEGPRVDWAKFTTSLPGFLDYLNRLYYDITSEG